MPRLCTFTSLSVFISGSSAVVLRLSTTMLGLSTTIPGLSAIVPRFFAPMFASVFVPGLSAPDKVSKNKSDFDVNRENLKAEER